MQMKCICGSDGIDIGNPLRSEMMCDGKVVGVVCFNCMVGGVMHGAKFDTLKLASQLQLKALGRVVPQRFEQKDIGLLIATGINEALNPLTPEQREEIIGKCEAKRNGA